MSTQAPAPTTSESSVDLTSVLEEIAGFYDIVVRQKIAHILLEAEAIDEVTTKLARTAADDAEGVAQTLGDVDGAAASSPTPVVSFPPPDMSLAADPSGPAAMMALRYRHAAYAADLLSSSAEHTMQNLGTVMQATTTQGVALLYGVDTAATAVGIAKILRGG